MAVRVNISVPDELAGEVRRRGIPVSAVCQSALRGAVREPVTLVCCGHPMMYQEFFGVRRYQCAYRARHAAIYVNQQTGERVADDELPWNGKPQWDELDVPAPKPGDPHAVYLGSGGGATVPSGASSASPAETSEGTSREDAQNASPVLMSGSLPLHAL